MPFATDPAFTIAVDPVAWRLDVAMIGYWDGDATGRFEAGLRAAVHRLRAMGTDSGAHVSIFDATGLAVQSAEVLAMLGPLAADTLLMGERVALVLTGALLKRQAQRVAPHIPIFPRRSDAIAWLDGDGLAPSGQLR
jgi:hypothetical protein